MAPNAYLTLSLSKNREHGRKERDQTGGQDPFPRHSPRLLSGGHRGPFGGRFPVFSKKKDVNIHWKRTYRLIRNHGNAHGPRFFPYIHAKRF
jgi:hypothetical protein